LNSNGGRPTQRGVVADGKVSCSKPFFIFQHVAQEASVGVHAKAEFSDRPDVFLFLGLQSFGRFTKGLSDLSCGRSPFHIHDQAVFDLQDDGFVDKGGIPRAINHDRAVHGPFSWKGEDLSSGQVRQHPWPVAHPVVVQFPFTPVDLKGHVGPRFGFDIDNAFPSEQAVHLADVFLDDVEIRRHATFGEHVKGHARHGRHPRTVFDGLTDGPGVREGVFCGCDNHLLLPH
jgi:hypothetical protein